MTEIEKLVAIEAIRQLKARYFRLMDTHDWEGLRAVFTDDAHFDVRGALEESDPDAPPPDPAPIDGGDAIVAYIRSGIEPITSVHHGHMGEIEILSPTEARGIWPMTDILRFGEGEARAIFRGYGHYRETYAREGGAWKIRTLRLTRLMVEKP